MKSFDTTPRPSFLRAMQNQSWTLSGAVAELVDNSFGSGRGDARSVVIVCNTVRKTIDVLDNGRGMDEIGRLFQLGNTIGRSPGDIGIYGSGGTMAVLWLAAEVEVWTLRDGKVAHDVVNWQEVLASDQFPLIDSTWQRASIVNTPPELLEHKHGTLIRLQLPAKRRLTASSISNLARDLSALYSPAIRAGRKLTLRTVGRTDGERSLGEAATNFKKSVRFDGVVEINDDHLPFVGRVGIVDDLPQSQSLVAIGYGIRVIQTTRDCYGSAESDEKFSGVGVCGYIDLGEGWQPYLATTKNAIDDEVAWGALMNHIFGEIKPLLKEARSKKLNMILDDLALQLQAVFGAKGRVEVEIQRSGKQPGAPDVQGVVKPHQPGTHEPEPDSKIKGDSPAATKLVIWEAADADLGGALCQFGDAGGDYVVYINAEHPAVAEAIDARPTNALALTLLINGEIAAEAARNEAFRSLLFRGRAVLDRIEQFSGWPGSFIHRLLMDRVSKKEVEAA